MSGRRTKKQKVNAKHTFSISWEPGKIVYTPEDGKAGINTSVKRQLPNSSQASKESKAIENNSENKGSITNLSTIRKDIIKSLGLASFILGIELVIYLFL